MTITDTLTVGSLAYCRDKSLKTAVHEIDAKDLLQCVGELPITSWNNKRDPHKRHMGPIDQDFHAAFGLNGDDETHISAVDIAGVSLAAIQALNSQMKVKDAEIAELREQIAALKTKAAAQVKAMADMEQTFSERMATPERRPVNSTRTAALAPS